MDTAYLLVEAVGMDTNISEVLGIEDQIGEALWIAFICK
jgi:hypothetical protein